VTLPPECPGGTPENSPAFQRRGTDHNGISPEGMAEYTPALEAPTTLSAVPLGLVPIQMKPGVETPGYSHKSLRDSRKEFNSVRVISLKLALMGQRPGLRNCAPLGLCKPIVLGRTLFGRAPRSIGPSPDDGAALSQSDRDRLNGFL